MAFLLGAIGTLCGLGVLICYIIVVVKCFQNGESTMGIVCLVTILCGVGWLVALIYGWMKVGAWGTQNLMYAYTACAIGALLFQGLGFAMGVSALPQ